MLSIDNLKALREAYSLTGGSGPEAVLRRIGDPTEQAIVASAVERMPHSDRNVRVLALRVLAYQRGARAMRGVLAGLNDEKRRVCAVAIQACPNYLAHEEIVARLEAIAREAGLKRKLRRRALSMLAGDEGRLCGDLTPAVAAALERLMTEPEYRFALLFGLVRLDLHPRVEMILESFATSAETGERQMARRAQAGERVIHIDGYSADETLQRWIMENCDRAHGRMYYWLPRAGDSQRRPYGLSRSEQRDAGDERSHAI
ncbi:MAG: hypothetical protein OXG85_05220 [Chloroflexi bacterium]|nr:hypothetical protein [Chloroflexota bacterium]